MKMAPHQISSLCNNHFTTVLLSLMYVILVTVDAVDYSKYTCYMECIQLPDNTHVYLDLGSGRIKEN